MTIERRGKTMNQTFAIRCTQLGFKATAIVANDAATAAKHYALDKQLGEVLLPLRTEKPVTVITNNSEADYVADQWSASTSLGYRLWITN
jgi:hypothetical protein